MSERNVLVQYVTYQRTERPTGQRVWSDGLVQQTSDDNPLPGPTESLERDRDLQWIDDRHLSEAQLESLRQAIRESGVVGLPPRLTINYCKEDPGTAIWTINIDGQTVRVVVYDPRPKRSAEIDSLIKALQDALAVSS